MFPNMGTATRHPLAHCNVVCTYVCTYIRLIHKTIRKEKKLTQHPLRVGENRRHHHVGSGEAASAEEITQCSAVEEEPAYGRCEAT